MAKRFEYLSHREFQRLSTLKKTRYLAELSAHLNALRAGAAGASNSPATPNSVEQRPHQFVRI